MRRLLPLLLVLLAAIAMSYTALAQESAPVAYFRFAHSAPDLSEVYLLINGNRTEIQNAGYRSVSEWYSLRADTAFRFSIGEVGESADISVTKRLQPNSYTTLTLEAGSTGRPTLRAVDAVPRVRVAHLAQGVGAVDVFVNGERTEITNVTVGNISGWVALPLGVTRFGVGPAGGAESYTVSTNLRGDAWTTIAAVGTADGSRAQLRVLNEDYGVTDPNLVRVTVFHAVPNLGAVNAVVNGATFIQNLAFPGTQGNNDGLDSFGTAAGTIDLQVTSTVDPSTVLFDAPGTVLFGGRAYFIAAYGLPGNTQLLVTSSDVAAVRGG